MYLLLCFHYCITLIPKRKLQELHCIILFVLWCVMFNVFSFIVSFFYSKIEQLMYGKGLLAITTLCMGVMRVGERLWRLRKLVKSNIFLSFNISCTVRNVFLTDSESKVQTFHLARYRSTLVSTEISCSHILPTVCFTHTSNLSVFALFNYGRSCY